MAAGGAAFTEMDVSNCSTTSSPVMMATIAPPMLFTVYAVMRTMVLTLHKSSAIKLLHCCANLRGSKVVERYESSLKKNSLKLKLAEKQQYVKHSQSDACFTTPILNVHRCDRANAIG